MIVFDGSRRLFRIDTENATYAFCILSGGKLCHLYFGARLAGNGDLDDLLREARVSHTEGGVGADRAFPQEYAVQEAFDHGGDALFPVFPDGLRGTRFKYLRHSLEKESLSVFLGDDGRLEVELIYRAYEKEGLIARGAVIRALTEEGAVLERAMSATVHLPPRVRRLTHFSGEWGREYTRVRQILCQGTLTLENSRGTCAAHQHVPFAALDDGTAGETWGEVYFAALCWSGDMRVSAEKDALERVRLTLGMNDRDFYWRLRPDRPLETPEVLLGFSDHGFEGMSRRLYDWAYDRALPREKAGLVRPVIYNSWYPYEFHVDEEKCVSMARLAASVGAELFVLDDGWMPGRTDEKTGLGDWVPDPARFPRGLTPVRKACEACGIGFGLWVEPEMVDPDSALFRAHPGWVIADPRWAPDLMRGQLVLDLSRDEVRDWCVSFLDRLIRDCRLDYLKWDMNRYLEPRGRDRELPVRYIQNLYHVWREIERRHPHVLFENCASGGGRADFGMLPFSDRINRSDNADPVDVMRIHEGFTTLFPPKLAGGAGNISPSPNGINGRRMGFPFRAAVGMNGSMSIGVDLLKCDDAALREIREAVERFKAVRDDLTDTYVLRLLSVYDGPVSALEYLRRDGKAVCVLIYGHGLKYHEGPRRVRLRKLDAAGRYRDDAGNVFSGAALMHIGVPIDLKGDEAHAFFHFTKED